jgi:flagellar assembly factor FliW
MKAAVMEPQVQTNKLYEKESIIRFEEGLIGFSDFKDFVLVEAETIKPLRLLQSATSTDVGFVVIDPRFRIADYYNQIPGREWEAIGVTDPAHRLAFVIVNVGLNPRHMTGNFQAPLLLNYEKMMGRQVILTDAGFSVRMPILA